MSKSQIERYAFHVPLMFEGDRGSGKTYDVREFARSGKIPYLEIAGNESLEAFDFLGHVMQSEHGMVWKDGKLSQAFRMAAEGKKVALLIDEMLRIPQRHLSVLLSALSPDSDGNYRLQTGRMVGVSDGIGREEELVAPSGNVAIFATTNVGPEFAIDDLDPAVAERFIILRKDTELAQLTKILEGKAALRSFSKLTALKLTEFFSKTQRMVKTGQLNRHATTRTLGRAIDLALDENDISQVLKDQVLLWVDRDSSGQPVKEQKEALVKTIDELFAVKVEKARKPAPPPAPPAAKPPTAPKAPAKPAVKRRSISSSGYGWTEPAATGFSAAASKWKTIEEEAAKKRAAEEALAKAAAEAKLNPFFEVAPEPVAKKSARSRPAKTSVDFDEALDHGALEEALPLIEKLARMGDHERAREVFERASGGGFWVTDNGDHFDPFGDPREGYDAKLSHVFKSIVEQARAQEEEERRARIAARKKL